MHAVAPQWTVGIIGPTDSIDRRETRGCRKRCIGRKATGYRQGYAKGMQQGMRKGLQKGIKEGRRKGVSDGMRHVILRQIKQRFGPAPVTLQRRIERIADARTLERVASAVLKANDLEQLRRLVAYAELAPTRRRVGFPTRREGPAGAVDKRRPRRLAPVRYPA